MIQHNCSKDGPTSPPRPRLPLADREILKPRDTCNYEKNFHFKNGQEPKYLHCGVFGDPHIRTFYDNFQTCKVRGAWPLLDNNYLSVQVTNVPLVKGMNSTAISKLTIIFKSIKECIDQKVYQAEVDNVPSAFDDGSLNGGDRQGGNSLALHEKVPGYHIEIWAAYIGTNVIIRQTGRHLSFAIRIPQEVASAFSQEQDLQLCMMGCPLREQMPRTPSYFNCPRVTVETARTKCKEGLPVEDVYFQACVFDIVTSGDANFTSAAYSAFEDAKRLHPDMEKLHIFPSSAHRGPILSPAILLIYYLVLSLQF
nr:PREDICTED: hemojuvelin isoform X2 [Latimeria chalumnae]|eukprot:XP_014341397.1 PREDICTED: hemojuvelin isoform X2 [Latimeria chalumnae]